MTIRVTVTKAQVWAALALINVVSVSLNLWMHHGITAILVGTLAALCVWAWRYERHRQLAGG